MNVNHSGNTKDNEESTNTHPFTLRLVIVFAGVLIALPLLPALITNLAYSFSGQAPKIYWYLSRAGGFIALTILWVSMAMGLGLTNKLARRWPGAPAAFAIHEYVSLLGLLFAVYHGLVLMGDHYVDFSLTRLLVPFSIKYEPFWVGLGQVAFYTWIIVLISFYIRQFIGQKTWRMIHYANFGIYIMGMLHGLFSGTDGTTRWAHWYYGLSTGTLIALLAYRVYITIHKKSPARPTPAVQPGNSPPTPAPAQATIDAPVSAVGTTVSQKPALEQAAMPLGFQAPMEQSIPASEPGPVPTVPEPKSVPQFLSIEEEQVPTSENVTADTQLPIVDHNPVTLKIFAEVPIPPADPDSRLITNPCQDQIQIPAYLEPVTAPSLRINGIGRSIQTQTEASEKVVIPDIRIHVDAPSKQTNPNPSPLILRIKENLPQKPVQPLIIRRRKREEILES